MRLLRFFMAGFSSLSSLGRFATAGSSGISTSCMMGRPAQAFIALL